MVPQVGEAHSQPLVQHGFRVAARPAGLDLLHGGPARVLHHALTQPTQQYMLKKQKNYY